MNVGRMYRRLLLKRRAIAQSASGEPIETFTDLATVWGQRVELRGAERYESQQVAAKVDVKYIIRYRDDVGPLDRFTEGGREYDISAVLEIGRRVGLELHAQARAE